MIKIEEQLSEMVGIKSNITHMKNTVAGMAREMTNVKSQINEYENNKQHYSAICDEILEPKLNTDNTLDNISFKMDKLQMQCETLNERQSQVETKLIDLQCRSMRENLIFIGISEKQTLINGQGERYEWEDVEDTLQCFLKNEMNRADRLGAHRAGQTFPRAMIAEFERFKDREEVKRLAPKTLIGKPFGVREQFPKEIEDKRKILYGEMKKAKRNPDNKVKLVRDKLFIKNIEYIPEEARSYENKTHKSRGRSFVPLEGRPYRDQSERRPEVSRTDTRYKSRHIYQRPGSSTELALFTRNILMNPIETSNRFEGLSEFEPSTPIRNDPI